jgi:hypothetical protein
LVRSLFFSRFPGEGLEDLLDFRLAVFVFVGMAVERAHLYLSKLIIPRVRHAVK